MRYFQLFLLFFLFPFTVFSIDISGVVRDASTGEVLVGANVYIKGIAGHGATTGLDGTFSLPKVTPGKWTLVCSYISYKTIEKAIIVPHSGKLVLNLDLVSYENELSDVVVVANGKTTDAGVRNIERLSSGIINVVGARSIEVSPDLTVANVVGRISGVTMEKNSAGEAEYPILRGMDKRYNITLVNGTKIASPDSKQRFVPLSIFPSELLDRLEVSKSRTADIEGDATGGAVNMVMKDAPYRFSITANASAGYNLIFFTQDFDTFDRSKLTNVAPYESNGKDYQATLNDFSGFQAIKQKRPMPNINTGFSYGNRFFNKKLGFIVAANLKSTYKGNNTLYFSDEMTQQDSTIKLTDSKQRRYSESQQQYGVHAKFDYVFSKKHRLESYNFYVGSAKQQVRFTDGTNFKLYYEPAAGNYDKSYQTRYRVENEYIAASMLHGEHDFTSRFRLNWTALYSQAGLERPDETTIRIDNLVINNTNNITIDGDGSDREWRHNSDKDLSGLINVNYDIPLGGSLLKLVSGGLYRNKQRDNFYVKYIFQPVNTAQPFETTDQIEWKLYTPKGSVGPLTYTASEDIAAGYLQGRYTFRKTELSAGLRFEYTNQEYLMAYPKAGYEPSGGQNYYDFLPNIQVRYSPQAKINWRAGYYRSLSRPGYFDIIPYQIDEEDYTEYGNPNLKHSLIDNVDVRWEYFPRPNDQLLIGAFYKNIQDPIEFAYYTINNRQGGLGLTNLGDARNFGFEVDWIKFIRIFGIKANYTFTHSAITTPKIYYGRTETGDTKTFTKDQTRPLVGQAAHVANVSILLKDVNHGWDAQLSASYTGDKIAIVSRYLNSDYWDKGAFSLDASIEKKFRNGWSVFVKGNNLLNTPNIRFVKTHNSFNDNFELQKAGSGITIVRREDFKSSFLIGARFKI